MGRHRGWLYIGLALAVGCGRVGYEQAELSRDAALPADAAPDQPDAACLERGRQLLENGGFEEPAIGTGMGVFAFVPAPDVPGWETDNPTNNLEIWESGHWGFDSAAGAQHIELNVSVPTAVYQDAATTPGTLLLWELYHRGRDGIDTLEVLIGVPGATLERQAVLETDLDEWERYEGLYLVPAGQQLTRFEFKAREPDGSQGNFLDEVGVFELECPTF